MVCRAHTAVISGVNKNIVFPKQDHWHQLNEFHYTSPPCRLCLFVFTHSLLTVSFCQNHRPSPPTPHSPLPTLAALMQFHPQRWRADSYNYPSVCEMNHWAADWAAWWETSILSSTTECSQPSTPSLCWCPGLAHVHTELGERGRVWSAAAEHCSRSHDSYQGNVVSINSVTWTTQATPWLLLLNKSWLVC